MTKPSNDSHAPRLRAYAMTAAPGLAAVALGLWSFLSVHPYIAFPFDDSYITQVFARNLFIVGGLSFDGVHATPGATSPVHIVLLAIVQRFLPFPLFSALSLGVLCHCVMVSIYCCLLLRLGCNRWVAMACGLLLGSSGFLLTDALNGLETSLFHALAAAATSLFLTGRRARTDVLLGLVLGLLVGTRPEGAFVALGFLAIRLTADRNDPSIAERGFASSVPMLAVFILVALAGRWNDITAGGTAMAKLYLWGELGDPITAKASQLAKAIFRFWLPLWYWILPIIVAGEFLFGLKQQLPWDRKRVFLAWGAAITIFYLVYLVLSPGALIHLDFRYQHILLPPVLFMAALYFDCLLRTGRMVERKWIPAALIFLCAAGLIHGHMYSRGIYGFFTQANRNALLPSAQWIQKNLSRDARIAAHDIGALGFYRGRGLLDISGLVNPGIRPFVRRGEAREYLELERPDYLAVLPDWAFFCLELDPASEPEVFKEVHRSSQAYDGPYVIYRCNWFAAPSEKRWSATSSTATSAYSDSSASS